MQDDSIKLLRECDAGIKMGISTLDGVLEHAKDEKLSDLLKKSKETHDELLQRAQNILGKYDDDGKEPAAMAKMMSYVKTNAKLGGEDSDRVVAELITDGCNMGIKSLYRYLHQYKAASDEIKKLVEDVIQVEDKLLHSLREYL